MATGCMISYYPHLIEKTFSYLYYMMLKQTANVIFKISEVNNHILKVVGKVNELEKANSQFFNLHLK